ncbi:hypothetical protein LJR289_004431 [Pseudoduganella sp. LjRoot289]|uniref:DUF6587 family protein n=1 Tax=Pseudoduganella sp. LjRoot289 TaxID=3342314 RepID=UPI003ED08885
MWQQIIVGLIVAAALLHACTKYLPAAWRRQIVYALSRRGYSQARLAKLFKVQDGCGSGCGSCGSCDTDKPAPPSPPTTHRVIKLHVQR